MSAELIKNNLPKKTLVYFTRDHLGYVISITTEENFDIKYFYSVSEINFSKKPIALILSYGRDGYWTNIKDNMVALSQELNKNNVSVKKYIIKRSDVEYTEIYLIN